MATLWSKLRRPKNEVSERLNVNEWATEMFKYQNSFYGLSGGVIRQGNKQESLGNNFTSYVNGAYKANGPIFACCMARMTVFSEIRFIWQKYNDAGGRPGDLEAGDDLDILRHPWPGGDTVDLLNRAIQDVDLCGNHYVVAEGVGENRRLRRLRPDWVDILLTSPPSEAVQTDIEAYIYRPGDTPDPDKWIVYPVDGSNGAIAHWAPIPDPDAMFRGMSWITPVLRELMGDKAATEHKLKFFENAATPNLAVALKETVTKEQFHEFMEAMNESKHGIEHAYETLYLGGGADVTVVGADMKQMDFRSVQGLSETRIAAAARVPAIIAGFSEGLQGSSLNQGNFQSAKDQFGDATLRPLWRSLCAAYAELLPPQTDRRLWYDDREIPFLRQDRKEVAEIQASQSRAIGYLIMQGFTPETIVEAVIKEDYTLLEHTGLYSVQLIPPGESAPSGTGKDKHNDADNQTGKPDANKPGQQSKAEPGKKPEATKPTTQKGTPK
jgi:phage portal protein BeeE